MDWYTLRSTLSPCTFPNAEMLPWMVQEEQVWLLVVRERGRLEPDSVAIQPKLLEHL